MSIPSTGKFEVEIEGKGTPWHPISRQTYHYDGRQWKGADKELVARLNLEDGNVPVVHYSIKERAEKMLHLAKITEYKILKVEYDSWESELPPGAID